MSPICKIFVQNAWKKDLCSNCFKTEEEHGSPIMNNENISKKDFCNDGGTHTKRYVGIADRPSIYSRNYYGGKTWNPLMIDNSSNDSRLLKSPSLIKGMDSFIKQENEKNRNFTTSINSNHVNETSRNIDTVLTKTNIPKDSWILTQIIGDQTKKTSERSDRLHGESSSDLGSDASHDTSSSSGNTSGCSDVELKGDSDTSSIKSEQDSAHEDEHQVHGILKTTPSLKLHGALKASISFNENNDVIGYGGDVDYSGDEDEYDDDDDDNSSISSSELTPEDRKMKRLTERNTDFNSENKNLQEDYVLKPVSDSEEEDYTRSYDLPSVNDTHRKDIAQEDLSSRQDVKVKLKRSHPIAGSKPQIKSNSTSPYSANVPSSLNTQSIATTSESIPMQGIKPKFVSRDEEMKENYMYEDIYHNVKVTSIDDIVPKYTAIDDIQDKKDDKSIKVTAIDDYLPNTSSSKVTSIDSILLDVVMKQNKAADISRIDSKHLENENQNIAGSSTEGNIEENLKTQDNSKKDDYCPKITYVDDISTYDDSICDIEKYQSCEIKESNPTENVNTTSDKVEPIAIDYSVRSAQDKIKEKDYLENNTGLPSSTKEVEMLYSTKNTSEVNALNMITIQRRSSFMESQLGGIEFSIEKTLPQPNSKIPCSKQKELKNDLVNKNSQKELKKDVIENNYKQVKTLSEKTSSKVVDGSRVTEKQEIKKESIAKTQNTHVVRDNISKRNEISDIKDTSEPKKNKITLLDKMIKDRQIVNSNNQKLAPSKKEKEAPKPINTENPSVKENSESKIVENTKAPIKKSPESKSVPPKDVPGYDNNNRKEKLNKNLGDLGSKDKICEMPLENRNITQGSTEDENKTQNIAKRDSKPNDVHQAETLLTPISNECKILSEDSQKNETLDKISVTAELKSNKNSPQSSLSTFGSQVKSSKPPNSSFLHSGAIKPVTEVYELNSIIYSTPEILKDIKPVINKPPVTASIQKSTLHSFHTSSTNLKVIQLGKPAPSQKPVNLKDKPKIAVKPFASPVKIQECPPDTTRKDNDESDCGTNKNSKIELQTPETNNEFSQQNSEELSYNVKNPQTPEKETRIDYDIPVTISSPISNTIISAPSPTSSSSGYSSTSNISQDDNASSPDSKTSSTSSSSLKEHEKAETLETNQHEIQSQYRAKFEATRNILSESLNFETKPILAVSESLKFETKHILSEHKDLPQTDIKFETKTETKHEIENIETQKPQPRVDKDLDNEHDDDPRNVSPSYVNLIPCFENHDIDSYSSFTDDFDDDDDDEDYKTNKKQLMDAEQNEIFPPPLRRTERSSSATPLFRNSVGPIGFNQFTVETSSADNIFSATNILKPPALRSQSVPRSSDIQINPSVFGKAKQESSSRFPFVKSSFFRPSSPPSMKRKQSSERGRDRTKKGNSVFSLRKLLRLGSGNEKSKSGKEPKSPSKESDKTWQRETRKMKLQIIHPLDYNTNGVEVIARPEKRSPTYDFTGINDPAIQEALRQHAIEIQEKRDREAESAKKESIQNQNKIDERESSSKTKALAKKVVKKNSFLRKRRKPERNDSERSEIQTKTYVRPSYSARNSRENLSSRSSREDLAQISREDLTTKVSSEDVKSRNENSRMVNQTQSNRSSVHLGFNSEGRPRPPPPPRKTSLDVQPHENLRQNPYPPRRPSDSTCQIGLGHQSYPLMTAPPPPASAMNPPLPHGHGSSTSSTTYPLTTSDPSATHNSHTTLNGVSSTSNSTYSGRADGDTSSLSSNSSSTRPHRPPPPRRTPSNCGSSSVVPVTVPIGKNNHILYANLGNARASFTPRKPNRTSSIKDEEREKRRAPNPPPPPQQTYPNLYPQNNNNSQKHSIQNQRENAQAPPRNVASSHETFEPQRIAKGPAPQAPTVVESPLKNHDYEYIDSPDKKSPPSAAALSSSSAPEKTQRMRGRRGSIVTNMSLEDQYGAVILANLEALSNMLDQICSHTESGGYEKIKTSVSRCSDVHLTSQDPIKCGCRLFYPATAASYDVTIMVTSETKVELDPLLLPNPIVTMKDNIPASFLQSRKSSDYSFSNGSLWVLPKLKISSLEEFSQHSQKLLQGRAPDWERSICLFLLQVVSALKQLQAKGIEETSLDMLLVITRIYEDENPRLLMNDTEFNSTNTASKPISLCHCASAATQLLLGHSQPLQAALKGPVLSPPFTPSPHAFASLVSVLREERSSSLTKAKCILETMLFGPEDLSLHSQPDSNLALQKWLDLERTNVLHSLVRDQSAGKFNKNCVLTKFQLLFLVRSNVKALRDAMKALQAPDVTNF